MSSSIWLIPCFVTLFLYGIGQGLVKKWSNDVPPALFCLFLVLARGIVNIGYFLTQEHPAPFSAEGMTFILVGVFAYVLDGLGWILYFESIVYGPITIVGTLSATYPALTLLFAQVFLKEQLVPLQYAGVAMVLAGCLGLSYSPPDPDGKVTSRRWIPMAITALVCWGAAQTLLKYSYSLPMASEANMALYATGGGILTLGLYGAWKLSKARAAGVVGPKIPFLHSFMPMAMMAGGDLGVIIASKTGPASIVAPLTGAYPLVTLGFAAAVLREHISKLQWVCLVVLLAGIGFSTIPQPPAQTEAPVQNEPVKPEPHMSGAAGTVTDKASDGSTGKTSGPGPAFTADEQARIERYAARFQGAGTQDELLAAYREAVKLSDDLMPRLEAHMEPLLAKDLRPNEADLAALSARLPGLQAHLAAEGTMLVLGQDYAAYASKAAATPEPDDNHFFALMQQAYGPVDTGYGEWFMRIWDYGGCTRVGKGLHTTLFKGIQAQRSSDSAFALELIPLEADLVTDLEQSSSYCLPKDQVLSEFEQVIPLAPATVQTKLKQRLQQVRAGQSGVEGRKLEFNCEAEGSTCSAGA